MKSIYTKQIIIASLLLFCTAFMLIQFSPIGLRGLLALTGGASILDMQFPWYSPGKAYEVLEALGSEGRAFNLTRILPLDILFPFSYSLLFCALTGFLYKTNGFKKKTYIVLSLSGPCAGLFDLMENTCVFIMLKKYPFVLHKAAFASNIFTQVKFMFFGGSFILIVIGVCMFLNRRRQSSGKR